MLELDIVEEITRLIYLIVEMIYFSKILDLIFEKKYENKNNYIVLVILYLLKVGSLSISPKYYEFVDIIIKLFFIFYIKVYYNTTFYQSISSYLIYYIAYKSVFVSLMYPSCYLVTGKFSVEYEEYTNKIGLYWNVSYVILNVFLFYIIKNTYIKLMKIKQEKRTIICIVVCIAVNIIIALVNYMPIITWYINKNISILKLINAFNVNSAGELCIISSIILGSVMIQVAQDSREKANNKILKEKLDMQYNYYLSIQESQMKVKRLYHDINNHMICIENMHGEKKEVNKYIDSIKEQISDCHNSFNTGNMILDIILNEKNSICHKNDISFLCDLDFSKCNFIEMIDVCCIFSNILDNSIEACNKINSHSIPKTIKIRGTVAKQYYIVKCENTKINKVKMKNNKFFTSKKDDFVHGLGIENIKSSLKKYDGEIRIEDLENKFIVKIYFPLKSRES